MVFDSGLSYKGYIKSVLSRVNKTINLLQKFQAILSWHSLITIYKSFIRPHLNYGNVIYNRTYIKSFHQTLESTQYSTAITMTGTLVEKIIVFFIQYFKVNFPVIFLNQYQILTTNSYATRSAQNNQIFFLNAKTGYFKNYFCPAVIGEWNSLQ